MCNKDLAGGVKSWNPPVLHFWRPLLFCWLLCFACMIFQQLCTYWNIASEAEAWKKRGKNSQGSIVRNTDEKIKWQNLFMQNILIILYYNWLTEHTYLYTGGVHLVALASSQFTDKIFKAQHELRVQRILQHLWFFLKCAPSELWSFQYFLPPYILIIWNCGLFAFTQDKTDKWEENT